MEPLGNITRKKQKLDVDVDNVPIPPQLPQPLQRTWKLNETLEFEIQEITPDTIDQTFLKDVNREVELASALKKSDVTELFDILKEHNWFEDNDESKQQELMSALDSNTRLDTVYLGEAGDNLRFEWMKFTWKFKPKFLPVGYGETLELPSEWNWEYTKDGGFWNPYYSSHQRVYWATINYVDNEDVIPLIGVTVAIPKDQSYTFHMYINKMLHGVVYQLYHNIPLTSGLSMPLHSLIVDKFSEMTNDRIEMLTSNPVPWMRDKFNQELHNDVLSDHGIIKIKISENLRNFWRKSLSQFGSGVAGSVRLFNSIIGLSVDQAREILKKQRRRLRVMIENGKDLIYTTDYRPDRVNVESQRGKITRIIRIG